MRVTGNISELRTTIGSLGSMMEVREMMLADGEPAEDIAVVDQNIEKALEKGDEIRRALLKRGDVDAEESSGVLSFMRMKREVKTKMAQELD